MISGMGTLNMDSVNCDRFEETLSEYLERTLDPATHRAMAAHAIQCPLCHALLNDVREAMTACHSLSTPARPLTRLEARILSATTPSVALACSEFEENLTDYLDGFLPADVFHRWERHAVMCDECTDLPGIVVRSIAAVLSYKADELPVPAGLHERILVQTIGTREASELRPSLASRWNEWWRGIRLPISVPQLAPVALMTLIAFLVFSQSVSADGSLSDVYAKGYKLAEETYKQGSEVLSEATGNRPVSGVSADEASATDGK